MATIYDEKVEQTIRDHLHHHETAMRGAKRRLEAAREELAEEERAVEHWKYALEDYRKSHGLPPQPPTLNPFPEPEYSYMGPTELVQHWSDNHGGEVVIKDLAKIAVKAGVFPNYRHGSSAIYAVVRRKGFEKVKPGHFKRIEDSHSADGHNLAIPLPGPSIFDDEDTPHAGMGKTIHTL